MINIVSGPMVLNFFKKSKYYRLDLGMVATVEKDGSRDYNKRDKFSYYFNTTHKTTINKSGCVGNINFYVDNRIRDKKYAVYYGQDYVEYIYDLDELTILNKGVDFYLGSIIKNIEEDLEKKDEKYLAKLEKEKVDNLKGGDSNLVKSNPSAVRFNDIKAYIRDKMKNRFEV